MSSKKIIRELFRTKRKNLDKEYTIAATNEINQKLTETIVKYTNTKDIVGIYYAIKDEINL